MRRIVVGAFLLCLFILLPVLWIYRHTSRYDRIIELAAARNGVDFYLVKAVIFEESWFQPDSRGSMGELGLMQVTMAAGADYCTKKGFPFFYEGRLLEPELNIEVGCWYLRQSLDRYKDSPDPTLFGLLRYNAGAARADAWLRQALSKPVPTGISEENYYLSQVDIIRTREYVRRILRRSRTHNFWF